jgi:ABC-type nitrate/sulfonate/bicarbonate transport system substrate-binding protein
MVLPLYRRGVEESMNASVHTFGRTKLCLLALIILVVPLMAEAQPLQSLSVIVFPGGFNWPIWAAQDNGYFARSGIEVKLTPTPSSVFQLTNLIEGKFDIGMTAFDNVAAYNEGQREVPATTIPDLVVFMGGDNGFLSLVTLPEIKTFEDLKGKTVSVDAVTTGYAFVLFDLLKRNGVTPADYKVEKAGGVLGRWEALKERKHAGTMLITPFDIIAEANGFNALQSAIDVYGHYQGLIGATRRSWAAANPKKLDAYIHGYLAGLEWLYDPKNKDQAIAVLRRNLPQMSPELAVQSYAVLLGAKGFARKAELDFAGALKVLELRSEYGQPKKSLTDPTRYYDSKYYEAAIH